MIRQHEAWDRMRKIVNNVMMHPEEVKPYIPSINHIAQEFVDLIRMKRDPTTLEVGADFLMDIKRWALENTGWLGLNTRLGCLGENQHPDAEELINNLLVWFDKSYDFDLRPSNWKVTPTPELFKLMESMDRVSDISIQIIEAAIAKIEQNPSKSKDDMSVVEKLIKKDKNIAKIMGLEMFFSGVDTVSINIKIN